MFKIAARDRDELPDVLAFAELVNDRATRGVGPFTVDREVYAARAPGRLDVMGGIADYSGSLVLQMPIAEACVAGVQRAADGNLVVVSLGEDREHTFKIAIDRIEELSDPRHRGKWYSYIAGVFAILASAKGADFSSGARVLVRSDVPIGKGVSSSASLEVSVMNAVCAAFEIEIEPRELAILCQRVENTIVGAACGVMDQVASNCGWEGSLLSLVCQPAEIGESVKIPAAIDVWGIDSGVRHSVSGSDYSSVRAAAFMGYRIIADIAGLEVKVLGNGVVSIADPTWNGYLANVSVGEYESKFRGSVPESITGRDFVERFGGSTDTVTTIDREKSYRVQAATEHAIYESARVREFANLLEEGGEMRPDASQPTAYQRRFQLGELMVASHASYRRCGLTETATDLLAKLAAEGRSRGIFGARITGGGSGGTVAILASSAAGDFVNEIALEYQRQTGREARVFHGSSPGCFEYGVERLVPSQRGT